MNQKIIIGRQDIADFPILSLFELPVKVDSGAYTSSLHSHNIEEFEENGISKIRFNLLDPDHEQYHEKEFVFEKYQLRKVKSSNGITEERFSIESTITIFEKDYPIELTLTERGSMRFPVLLGRKFLSKYFVIDTSKKNLSIKKKINYYPK